MQANPLTVAHHHGTGGEVPEAFAAGVDEEGNDPDAVEDGQEVDDPNQVARCRLAYRDRLTLVPDHPEPGRALSQCLPGEDRLADQKVSGEEDEAEDQSEEHRDLGRIEDDADRDRADEDHDADGEEDQGVDELGQKAAADPGDLVLKRDPFRGGDDEVVRLIRGSHGVQCTAGKVGTLRCVMIAVCAPTIS